MTVKELIETLSELNQEAIVVKSKDDEGNAFHPLFHIETGMAIENPGEHYLELGYKELTPDLIEDGFTEEDLSDGPEAVVLY
jgi:hypothetical protein